MWKKKIGIEKRLKRENVWRQKGLGMQKGE